MNLQDCGWEIRYRIIMKTTKQEKETIHYSITIWFTNLILCFGGQGMGKIGENFGVERDSSRKQIRGDR